jgi:acyl-CoA synthetase (AMP-forming)/AMP-acid ligase II
VNVAAVGIATDRVRELPDTVETIPEGLAFWAERTPEAPAVRSVTGRELSHGELQEAVARVVARLGALGMQRGACIATSLHGGIEACAALLGVMTVGAAVPFNPAATGHELARDLGRLRVDLLVTDGAADRPAVQAAAELGVPTVSVGDVLGYDGVSDLGMVEVRPASVAAILHTSGTTGLPKRVPRDHRSFVVAARAARQTTGLTSHDVALLVGGVYTNAGLSNVLFALLTGGSCVVAPGFDPALVPDWIVAHRPTWALLNATELNLILDDAARAGRPPVSGCASRLRAIRAGSQPMTPGTAERAEVFFGAPVFEGYGMSEASNIAKSGPRLEDRRPGSCGRPVAGTVDVRILDEADADAAPGVAGAVVVRGPTVFSGYLDDPEANAAAFTPDGWFRTGDLGCLDGDGFLYLKGRQSELINRGGEKIAPAEVDRVLQGHPAVAEAAVFAIPDATLGEDLVAAVAARPGMQVSVREMRVWLLGWLSPSRAPRRIWMVEALPRTASGKVQRGELARRWLEAQG